MEGKRSILLSWQPAFQQGGMERREGCYQGTLAAAVSAIAECLDGWQQGLGGLPYVSV